MSPGSSTRDRRAVCILARAPSAPGKTRLTEGLSVERAVALRRALLLDTFESVVQAGMPVVVCYTPSTAREELEALVRSAALIPQASGDLGSRMRSAFDEVFALGFERVVLIGSDLPTLPPDHLIDAITALDRASMAIGPAADGGYYLVGLREAHPELFDGVRWGAPEVLKQTLSIAERVGLTVDFVPPWHDVDTPDDLQRVSSSSRARHTRAWLDARRLNTP